MSIHEKFARLATDNAPGQEVRQSVNDLHAKLGCVDELTQV